MSMEKRKNKSLYKKRTRRRRRNRSRNRKQMSIMKNLSDYFTLDTTIHPGKGVMFYTFDNAKRMEFIQDCLLPFREAYIESKKLQDIVNIYGVSVQEAVEGRLPDKGKVMSGDFGEILCLYLAVQLWSADVTVIPMKWRLKDKKKDASHYTDVIMFKLTDKDNPSVDDKMYTYEVKTRASKLGNTHYKLHKQKARIGYKDGKLECTFIEAVVDAYTDAVQRAAETIPYLKIRCQDEGLKELHDKINRFSTGGKGVTFQREHNAVAVIDSSDLNIQVSRIPPDLFTAHASVNNVYCVPIADLQALYESIYQQMPNIK